MEQIDQSPKPLKTADKKVYMKNYMADYLKKECNRIQCDICYGTYRKGLQKAHNMTRSHIKAVQIREYIKTEGMDQTSVTVEGVADDGLSITTFSSVGSQ